MDSKVLSIVIREPEVLFVRVSLLLPIFSYEKSVKLPIIVSLSEPVPPERSNILTPEASTLTVELLLLASRVILFKCPPSKTLSLPSVVLTVSVLL